MSKAEFLELSQAVVRLGSSERTIRRRIEVGELVGKKVGRKWYVQLSPPMATAIMLPADPVAPIATNFHTDSAPAVGTAAADPGAAGSAGTLPSQPTYVPPAQPAAAPSHQPSQSRPENRPPGPSRPASTSNRGERRWGRGHEGYTPASGDILDHAFAVGKLAAWRKVQEMRAFLKSPDYRAEGDAAAAALLEGFLGFGMQKIDCYRECRAILCRLVTRLESADVEEDHIMATSDALGAVHALVITLNRRNSKDNNRPAN